MEAYTSFAKVYDTFMDETPYEEWGVREGVFVSLQDTYGNGEYPSADALFRILRS